MQRVQELRLARVLLGGHHEEADDRRDDARRCEVEGHGDEHRVRRERGRGDDGADEGLEEVGAHAGDVTDVVADVVSDGSGVARVVLRDVVLNLAHEVGADVGGLGVDATADAAEHGNGGSAEAVAGDDLHHHVPVILIVHGLVDGEDDEEHEEAEAGEREAHHTAGAEGRVEGVAPAARGHGNGARAGGEAALGSHGGAHVTVHGHHHANVARGHGGHGTEDESQRREGAVLRRLLAPGDEAEDDEAEDHDEHGADAVLREEERLGAVRNLRGHPAEHVHLAVIESLRVQQRRRGRAVGHLDLGDQDELDQRERERHAGRRGDPAIGEVVRLRHGVGVTCAAWVGGNVRPRVVSGRQAGQVSRAALPAVGELRAPRTLPTQ
mmetsp:Transcript_22617/g.70069  ORF Transcript_22617/g.70069 Transcript_22617/m.70069 type:complete len:382 (-) Transcript_22617:237-1382(-)